MGRYNPDDFTLIEPAPNQATVPIPTNQDPANPWLPKTDWGRDKIIANEDFE